MKTFAAIVVALALGGAVSAQGRQAQGRQGQGAAGDGQDLPGISPAEVQQMFDSAALIQAQERLKIRDDQFPQFLRRFKIMQEIRRQWLNERMRRLNQLQRMLTPAGAAAGGDDAAITEQLKAIKDLDAREVADVAKAYDAIDQVLDVRQRAQFRVFEETMERQKLELVTRARQANRPKP